MIRRTVAVVLAVVLAGLISAPVGAKPKGPKATTLVYYMNWAGDCAGSGFLAPKLEGNPDGCALYFPGLMPPAPSLYGGHVFPALSLRPFKLNAKQPISVDFRLSNVSSVAADFVVTVEGTVNGKDVTIGSATQQVTSPVGVQLHFEVDPAAELDKGKVTGLSVSVDWTGGVTYSQIDFESGPSVTIPGYK
jgi:hypothetical protein